MTEDKIVTKNMHTTAQNAAPGADEIGMLDAALNGRVVTPEDPGYDEARAVWNGAIDKYPAAVVRCVGVADVIDAVRFARRSGLPVAVRGGAHNVAGNATCDGGIVIDVGPMNSIRVDVKAQRVRAGAGATIGQVDRETQAFGLAVPLGVVSGTGIAGLTLCGGHSWLTRKHGFACDNLISVDLVTADGRYLTASEEENQELFWAARGGGGNFGIVTSFEYRAHPVGPEVTFCGPFYPMEEARQIFRLWRDAMEGAPDEYTSQFVFWSIPAHESFPAELHGREVVIPAGVHCGPVDEAAEFIAPLRRLREPLLDLSGPAPYLEVQQSFDPFFLKKGERLHFWKSLYLDRLDDDVIERIVARAAERPDPWTLLSIRLMGGAAGRVPADAVALGGRDAAFMLSIDTGWTDPAISERAVTWTREFWEEMRRGTSGATYLNFVGAGEDSESMMRASYGEKNYERLVGIKTRYDPENLFRLNQNIRPRAR
ncbi:MAG: FAD-binding oxidoreductase [Wenzhouxiangellaceae bacterium]|nr:FAD-binding oxidoreductase [Wenzhouxiangellaceae bacterium]